jgi:hypothetical protein
MGPPPTQQIAVASHPTNTATRTTAFRFMDLPAELRVQVYEELLVVGKVFYTPDPWDIEAGPVRLARWTTYAAPSLSILRVSKQIHHEAEPVYHSKNLFVLPDFFHRRQPFSSGANPKIPHHDRWLFSKAGLTGVKNSNVSFNTRTDTLTGMNSEVWQITKECGDDFKDLSYAERLENAHAHAELCIQGQWRDMTEVLYKVAARYKTLEVDLTSSYCPIGCCRDFEHGARLIGDITADEIYVLGVQHQWEKEQSLEELFSRLKSGVQKPDQSAELMKEKYKCDISPTKSVWESWRILR